VALPGGRPWVLASLTCEVARADGTHFVDLNRVLVIARSGL